MSDERQMRELWERRLLDNLKDAWECGYDLACPVCGSGIYDDSDEHDELTHRLAAEIGVEVSER